MCFEVCMKDQFTKKQQQRIREHERNEFQKQNETKKSEMKSFDRHQHFGNGFSSQKIDSKITWEEIKQIQSQKLFEKVDDFMKNKETNLTQQNIRQNELNYQIQIPKSTTTNHDNPNNKKLINPKKYKKTGQEFSEVLTIDDTITIKKTEVKEFLKNAQNIFDIQRGVDFLTKSKLLFTNFMNPLNGSTESRYFLRKLFHNKRLTN